MLGLVMPDRLFDVRRDGIVGGRSELLPLFHGFEIAHIIVLEYTPDACIHRLEVGAVLFQLRGTAAEKFGAFLFQPLHAGEEKIHLPKCEQHDDGIIDARAEDHGDEVVRGPVDVGYAEDQPYGKEKEVDRRKDGREVLEHLRDKEPGVAVKEADGLPLRHLPPCKLPVRLFGFGEARLADADTDKPADQPIPEPDRNVYEHRGKDAHEILRSAADGERGDDALDQRKRAQQGQKVGEQAQDDGYDDEIARGIHDHTEPLIAYLLCSVAPVCDIFQKEGYGKRNERDEDEQ